ncbi:hypothetical protein Micbo1qcDRAFT_225087 [Microdochium bolleyi]|uniref:DUF7492 domain-containing protein n=1 Tax=Microdochium bolleyi TaxID=196109 RepID=A0A136J255_9PEZI|nr:hypothetical protein Micbo1qcDRAFT_225087 [Microdochium bolleyi]
MAYRAAKALVALLAVAPLADAHSWVEFLKRINPDGSFAKGTGYPIPYVARGAPGFSDDALINRIVDTKSNPSVCKQGNFKYSKDAPRLSAAAGDYVAMLYEENGHVTQPGITKRPYRSGNVYVYGTLKKTAETGINDVLYSWNAQGTGGDKRGQLLATHFYDDGQCYQNLGGVEPDPQANIYTNRRKKYGATAIDCQSAFRLPTNLPEKGIYNVMWVWDWPLITGDNTNVTEIYTSCAEIELGSKKSNSGQRINFSSDHNVTNGAIQSQIHTLIEAVTLGSGTNSPPAPTATAGNPAPTSATATGGASVTTGPATVTVTVTAPPVTTTVFQTVTFGAPQASSSLAPGSLTDSAVASPTKQPSLAPTNVPTQHSLFVIHPAAVDVPDFCQIELNLVIVLVLSDVEHFLVDCDAGGIPQRHGSVFIDSVRLGTFLGCSDCILFCGGPVLVICGDRVLVVCRSECHRVQVRERFGCPHKVPNKDSDQVQHPHRERGCERDKERPGAVDFPDRHQAGLVVCAHIRGHSIFGSGRDTVSELKCRCRHDNTLTGSKLERNVQGGRQHSFVSFGGGDYVKGYVSFICTSPYQACGYTWPWGAGEPASANQRSGLVRAAAFSRPFFDFSLNLITD